ncbi:hypothetical protein SK128_001770, partial [Halocaridina rubra]
GFLDVQKEAIWTICNLTRGGTEEQISQLIDDEGTEALVRVLSTGHKNIIQNALEALNNILKNSQREEEVKSIIKENGGRESLQSLLSHKSGEISAATDVILQTLRESDDDDDDDSSEENDNEDNYGRSAT